MTRSVTMMIPRLKALLLCLLLQQSKCSVPTSDDDTCVDGTCKSAEGDQTKESSNDNSDQQKDLAGHQERQECGIWFAHSTIPNSGLGMFAGRDFEEEETMMETGDIAIPIVDIEMYQVGKWTFLWDQYTWNADALRMEDEGVYEINVASPGFGSAANSFRDLHNVEEWMTEHSLAGLHRSRDPGAGGFTPYHNRISTAKVDIPAGQELFVNYGNNWFLERAERLGPIPIKGDLPKANTLLKRWERLRHVLNTTKPGTDTEEMVKDLWETFVWNSPYSKESRQFFALPKDWEETEQVSKRGLVKHRKLQSTRSLEFLEENGICGDNIREDISTIPQAGRGAFATRALKKDSLVAPLPLIHVPYRKRMEMYRMDNGYDKVKNKDIVGYQLLLNYCFGHRESTLLLCPYGLLTGFVNHGSGKRGHANVRLQWSDPKRASHQAEFLNSSVKELVKQKHAVMAMELVALRDIKKGEEILIDYGEEWEEAWEKHVANWKPVEGADSYVPADDLNANRTSVIKTAFEEMHDPYPGNVNIKFDLAFDKKHKYMKHMKKGTLDKYKKEAEGDLVKCDVLRWTKQSESGRIFYTIAYTDFDEEDETKKHKLIHTVPRESLVFVDKPYTGDLHMSNVFRHDMRIPDDIFPEAWKNAVNKAARK